MSLNIEYEDRVMLSENQYHEILTSVIRDNNNPIFISQRNDYIDTPELYLKEHHMVLRIRTVYMGEIEFTLKVKGENGDSEFNQLLPLTALNEYMKTSIIPEGEVKAKLIEYNIDLNALKIITSLETRRYEEKIDDYLLVLDKNNYNNIEDYNIEIEASSIDRAKQVMDLYCKKFNVEHVTSKSKSRRAFESITK